MAEFKMPPIGLGEIVYWYPDASGGHRPHVGVVTDVGSEALSVWVFLPRYNTGQPREGVRYISDPVIRLQDIRDRGCWEYTAADSKMKVELAELRKEVNKLRAKVFPNG